MPKNITEVPSVEQYEEAIENALSSRQRDTLQVLYYFPNSSATAKELAQALDYSGYQAANRQVGQIGKTISQYLDVLPPLYDSGHEMKPSYYLLVGQYYRNTGWNMWAALQQALENLHYVSTEDREGLGFYALPTEEAYTEGKVTKVYVNKYERSRAARLACLKHHGYNCQACGFNFGEVYGEIAEKFIHVHHKSLVSQSDGEYQLDPVNDLVPLCANCHSVAHLNNPVLTLEQLKGLIQRKK